MVFDDVFNGSISADQNQRGGPVLLSQKASRTATYASAANDQVSLRNQQLFGQEFVNLLGVCFYSLGSCFYALINSVSRILNCQNIHFQIHVNVEQKLLGSSDVLGVCVEVDEGLALGVLALQPETRDEVLLIFAVKLQGKKTALGLVAVNYK